MKFGKYRVVKHTETKTEGIIAARHRYALFEILTKDQEINFTQPRRIIVISEGALDELILYGDCEIELKQPQQKLEVKKKSGCSVCGYKLYDRPDGKKFCAHCQKSV